MNNVVIINMVPGITNGIAESTLAFVYDDGTRPPLPEPIVKRRIGGASGESPTRQYVPLDLNERY